MKTEFQLPVPVKWLVVSSVLSAVVASLAVFFVQQRCLAAELQSATKALKSKVYLQHAAELQLSAFEIFKQELSLSDISDFDVTETEITVEPPEYQALDDAIRQLSKQVDKPHHLLINTVSQQPAQSAAAHSRAASPKLRVSGYLLSPKKHLKAGERNS